MAAHQCVYRTPHGIGAALSIADTPRQAAERISFEHRCRVEQVEIYLWLRKQYDPKGKRSKQVLDMLSRGEQPRLVWSCKKGLWDAVWDFLGVG